MSERTRKPGSIAAHIVKAAPMPTAPVAKAEHATSMEREEQFNAGEWIQRPLDYDGIDALVDHSTILPQCIQAYKNNIVGFGIYIDYQDEYKNKEETPEMVQEYNQAKRILDLLAYDCSTQEMFGRIVATRERYGIAYVEVIRTLDGQVAEIVNIQYPSTIEMTVEQDEYIPVPFYYNGEQLERKRRFRKFRQTVGARVVYFKEFGDPRLMDMRDGNYYDNLDLQYRANEILAFPIGDRPYGTVRWVGQIAGIDGAFKAEQLNRNYFDNGRHTPMLIMVSGGTLTDESFNKLREYMNEIKGVNGQHAFMVLEAENVNTDAAFEEETVPKIEIKDLSPMLQKDELFQGYLDNVRRKCQSAFRLPDLFVGYTTDFNRATAQTAMEITEKQVFIPERQELAWIINRKLLADYQFRFVEVNFRAPDVTNPDDQAKILNIAERAGGVTPNEAHKLAMSMTGDSAEDFDGDWGNVPLAYAKIVGEQQREAEQREAQRQALAQPQASQQEPTPEVDPEVVDQLDDKIEDAAGYPELVAVMKQIRRMLTKAEVVPDED